MRPCCFRSPIPEPSTGPPWRRLALESAFFRREPNRMTPDVKETEGLPEPAEHNLTERIGVPPSEQPDAAEPEEKKTVFGSLQEAYRRAKDGRKAAQPERQNRTAKTVDRSKALLLLAAAVIVLIFVFLGLFSSPSGTKDRAANRSKPSLGRQGGTAPGTAAKRGSVTPLLDADTSGQDASTDQISADDVKATRRLRMGAQAQPGKTLARRPAYGSGSGSVSPGEGRPAISSGCAADRKRRDPRARG